MGATLQVNCSNLPTVTFFSLSLCKSGHCPTPISSITTRNFPYSLDGCFSLKRCLLSIAALCAVSLSTAQAAQPLTAPVLASDIADRYANLIYYGSGATGMALVVIDGNRSAQQICAARRSRSDISGNADQTGESGDPYQRPAARTARWRCASPCLCLANP